MIKHGMHRPEQGAPCPQPSWRFGFGNSPEYPVGIPGRTFVGVLTVGVVRRFAVVFGF